MEKEWQELRDRLNSALEYCDEVGKEHGDDDLDNVDLNVIYILSVKDTIRDLIKVIDNVGSVSSIEEWVALKNNTLGFVKGLQ